MQRSRGAEAGPPPVDADADGIDDVHDKCPRRAGLLPDGCPRADRDHDGYVDDIDGCPDIPGDYPDGCATEDADHDGVLDVEDRCPAKPGVAPDGCPEKKEAEPVDPEDADDDDLDGVPNGSDRCPQRAESVNGYDDEDGCPDQLPVELGRLRGVVPGVAFEDGGATLQPESAASLDGVAGILSRYPQVRIEIVGHTDSEGDDEANRELSRLRAQTVRAYLVRAGVDARRVQVRGAGEDEPLATHATEAGRADNRRIEIGLLTR